MHQNIQASDQLRVQSVLQTVVVLLQKRPEKLVPVHQRRDEVKLDASTSSLTGRTQPFRSRAVFDYFRVNLANELHVLQSNRVGQSERFISRIGLGVVVLHVREVLVVVVGKQLVELILDLLIFSLLPKRICY